MERKAVDLRSTASLCFEIAFFQVPVLWSGAHTLKNVAVKITHRSETLFLLYTENWATISLAVAKSSPLIFTLNNSLPLFFVCTV